MAHQSLAHLDYRDAPRLLPVDAARLAVRSVTCRPRERRQLQSISLDVERGELLALVGPAGAGKSLLLRVIAGLEQPDSGLVYLDGEDVTDLPPSRRGIRMAFSSGALPPHRRLRDLLAPSSGPLFFWRGRQDEGLLRSRLALVAPDLLPSLDARLGRLPPAAQAQASLAWAIFGRPRLLLLDDPLARVGEPLRGRLARHLKQLVEALEITTVYATLDQAEGLSIGHRTAVLNSGALEQVSTAHGLETLPRNLFVATWVHYAGLNLFGLRLELAGSAEPRLVGPGLTIPVDPAWVARLRGRHEVVVAVRPERLRVVEEGVEALYRAVVRAVEPLPWERHKRLHLTGPTGEQVALVGADTFTYRGLGVGVRFDLADALFFDASTGEALR